MNPKEFLESLLAYLKSLKEKGQTHVPMDGVIANLENLSEAVGAAGKPTIPPEKMIDLQAQFDLEHYRAQIASKNKLFETVMTTSDAAAKSLFLVNGGG